MFFSLMCALMFTPEIHEHPGGKILPSEKYIHVVSEIDSPLERVAINGKDEKPIPAVIRKPKGKGPFPVLIHFHGAPGGRGIEKLVTWSRGDTGGPVWERFLKEGFVVVTADYRAADFGRLAEPIPAGKITYVDDGQSVVEYVKKLPYVDPNRVTLYGVSLGGDVAIHTASRVPVKSLILGAPATIQFLGLRFGGGTTPNTMPYDAERATKNIKGIQCPILIMVGTKDFLQNADRLLHELLEKAGKSVRLEIFQNGYHDFVMGPQGHIGRDEPLMDITLASLEIALKFAKEKPSAQ